MLEVLWPTFLVCGLALALQATCNPKDNRARTVVFAICIALSWRYLHWRFTATLPPLSSSFASLYAWGFALLESSTIVASTLAFATMSRTLSRSAESDEARRRWLERLPAAPRVDVLIATYNEEEAILERTIVGALGLDHPGIRVWVLDDGRRDWLRSLCERKGARYLTRADNAHAKAGNINHALGVIAREANKPEFLAVLDADFVPYPQLLRPTLPLFHDADVALVQTPQYFFNNDPIQSNLLIGNIWPDEQRFFFEHVMSSKDAWGTAFCCGTSSVIRLAALEEIGGFPTGSVTEDFLLTLRLDERGWRTVYLNERLSAGLAPEGIKEYVVQRGRWCLGLMQIVRSRLGPFGRSPLSLRYRLGLIDAFLYWASTYTFRFACFCVPIVYWFTGVGVLNASIDEVIWNFLPSYAAAMLALGWATGGMIQPVLTDVSQVLTMFEAIKATALGIARPKGHGFKVTAKGGARNRYLVQWGMIRRFGVLLALTLGGIAFATFGDFAPHRDGGDGRAIVLVWSVYNVVVLIVAACVCAELPRYRKEERFATDEAVTLVLPDGGSMSARLRDLSVSGARVAAPRPAATGSLVKLQLPHLAAPLRGQIVAGSESAFAVAFQHDETSRDHLIRKLFSGDYVRYVDAIRGTRIAGALLARWLR